MIFPELANYRSGSGVTKTFATTGNNSYQAICHDHSANKHTKSSPKVVFVWGVAISESRRPGPGLSGHSVLNALLQLIVRGIGWFATKVL
jgi:hypothetical protein